MFPWELSTAFLSVENFLPQRIIMAVKNTVQSIPLTSVSATTFDGVNYKPINPAGVPESLFAFTIINQTNQDIFISYDGATNHDFIPENGTVTSPVQYNARPNTYIANLA